MKDLFGKAILDYQTNNSPEDIITETNISEPDELSVEYLFRGYEEMPEIERRALDLAKGRVLDVGCGAGSHSLYLQNDRNLDVVSIDISPAAIKACQLRGVRDAQVIDVTAFDGQQFDTILLLMNGAGMSGRLSRMYDFLNHLKGLLADGGQLLLDSSDIIYMFDDEEDGSKMIPLYSEYYGELVFTISYKNEKEKPFDWLYIDYNTLQNVAVAVGFSCELVQEGEHYDYLAKLTVAS
ncbi:MAG: class I SAM-dependent methyltransferase [Flavobacteriales bacterium]|nr:class I SAM-dependent methyltransferase [Flavobacteriales bacterium]